MNFHSLSLALAVLFLLPETLHATPVFLENVSESGGWYDCNKKTKWDWGTKPDPNPLNPPISARPSAWSGIPLDTQLCWAAAASNVLQWWQDTRSDLKPTTPNGKSATYDAMPEVSQLSIFQTIAGSWTDKGGSVEQAYNWWFNGGKHPDLSSDSTINNNPVSQGGYWTELGLTVPVSKDGGISENPLFDVYSFYNENTRTLVYGKLKDSINNNWGTTLTIGEDGRGHAITMWGYDTDEDGNLIVYLTDSDDYKLGMFRQKVIVNDYDDEYDGYKYHHCDIYLTSLEDDDDVYNYLYDEAGLTGIMLGEIQSFTAPLGDLRIPEPSTGILSLCGVCLIVSRRRRSTP